MHTPEQCPKHTPQCINTTLLEGFKIRCSEMQSGSILCSFNPVVFTFIYCIYFSFATISVCAGSCSC